MHPLNILHIIPNLTVGGVENQLSIVLKNYDKRIFSPYVCCLSGQGEIGKEIESNGIKVVYLNKLKHQFDWSIIRDIYRLIRRWDIKIVRTHQYHANLYGRIAAFMAKAPCIISSIHNVYTIDKKIHRRLINKYLTAFTDKVVAVSNAVKKDILEYDKIPEDKIIVIYNGVEIERFLRGKNKDIRAELKLNSDTPLIGTVGRLTIQKGHKFLIEAIAKLKKDFPNITLLIVGDGPLRQELKDYAETLRIGKNVMFLGVRRDIPEILSTIDIFVLSSLWEGLCNSLIEAMAAEKPVIATDIPAVREIISSEKMGILIPPKNSEAITDAISLLLKNKSIAQNLCKSAKERVLSIFTIDKTVSCYSNLFIEILKNKGIK